MQEILTQKEIDALLAAGDGGAEAATDVVPWDFAGVPRVPRARQAVLEAVFTRYAQLLESLLAERLRLPAAVSLEGVEEVGGAELLHSLADPCAAAVFEAGEREAGAGVLDLGTELALTLLDRMFGGSGEEPAPRRPLTVLEQTVLRSFAERALEPLREAWQGRLRLEPRVTAFASDPGAIRSLDRGAEHVAASFAVRLGGRSLAFVLGLPAAAVQAGLRDPQAEAGRARRRGDPAVATHLRQALLTLTARVPAVRLSLREIRALAPGQVLQTGLAMDTPVELHVNGEPRFEGSLGQVRRHVGLRIVQQTAAADGDRARSPKRGRVL